MFYAFSSFDPKTFQVRVEDNDDAAMMKEFTGLSMNGGPQTWIAIGGSDFSATAATHTAW